ncbi:TsoY family (seleno)protein [Neobacillus sp. LXY-4]|uniref:TsoY family (seleno)protein n=1 Tax=Neobacillus sp. LXY-4 TaxID=3379826 RepID=UPI003EE33EAF
MKKNLRENYNPMYFLASLGSGGLAVSFFMYLMFMVKHPGRPMANFEHVFPALTGDNVFLSITVAIALLGILFFSYKHFRLLFWNLAEYKLYKKTAAYEQLRQSNGEVSLMAIPLTLGMTVNAVFIIAAVFIPNLWSIVEYLFPFAVLAYFAVGVYAFVIFKRFFTRFVLGGFDFGSNNSLVQMLSVFAFTMVAVGFAAPAAMSHTLAVSVISTVMAVFFGSVSVVLLVVNMTLGIKSIFKHGIDKAGSPSLWMIIPILTLLGITIVRLYSGINHNLLHNPEPAALNLYIPLMVFVSIQVMFGFIGYSVLKKLNYFGEMIHGSGKSPGSFSLICPGVAFFVLGMFFIHWGFVKTGIVTIFSPVYFAMLVPFVFVQFKSVQTLLKLNRKLLSEGAGADVVGKAV